VASLMWKKFARDMPLHRLAGATSRLKKRVGQSVGVRGETKKAFIVKANYSCRWEKEPTFLGD